MQKWLLLYSGTYREVALLLVGSSAPAESACVLVCAWLGRLCRGRKLCFHLTLVGG